MDEGRQLELLIHNRVKPFVKGIYTGDHKVQEKVDRGGKKSCYGIDHLIFIDDEHIITVQDKWESAPPGLDSIDHFTMATRSCIERLMEHSVTPPILVAAIFVSRIPMTDAGLSRFKIEGEFDVCYAVSGESDIERLANAVTEKIKDIMMHQGLSPFAFEAKPIILRPHQEEAVNNFLEQLTSTEGQLRGIMSLPTGTGKTIIGLTCIGHYMRMNPGASIIWLTERIDVLNSQFKDTALMDRMIITGHLPDYTSFSKFITHGQAVPFSKIMASKKPVLLITNIDSIMASGKYKKFDKDRFGMIVLDESHSSGADGTSQMLSFFIEHFTNLKVLLGMSATPIGTDSLRFENTMRLFGNGRAINFIHKISFLDAIDMGLIVPMKFYWVYVELKPGAKLGNIFDNVDHIEYMLQHIETVLSYSATKKAICWTNKTEEANRWYAIMQRNRENPKYVQLSTFKVFISHTADFLLEGRLLLDDSGRPVQDGLDLFNSYDGPALIICAQRCREGYDDPRVDTAIHLVPARKRGELPFLQKIGRAVRLYDDDGHYPMKEVANIMDCITTSDETSKTEAIFNMIAGYSIFLNEIDGDSHDVAYEKVLKSISITSKGISVKTQSGKIIEFLITSSHLFSLDLGDLNEGIRRKIQEKCYKEGIGYQQARKIVQRAVPRPKTPEEYMAFAEADKRVPPNPEEVFHPHFRGWCHFLSINPEDYYTLEEFGNTINTAISEGGFDPSCVQLVYEELYGNDPRIPHICFISELYGLGSLEECLP